MSTDTQSVAPSLKLWSPAGAPDVGLHTLRIATELLGYPATPAVLMDTAAGVAVARELSSVVGEVCFAVKAGPYPPLLADLAAAGFGFDVASAEEIDLVSSLVSSGTIICSNPAMPLSHVELALARGLYLFVTDSVEHTLSIVNAARSMDIDPTSIEVIVRLALSDPSASYHLSEKFGTSYHEALDIISFARKHSLQVRGVAFHLGSQAQSADAAEAASRLALDLVRQANIKDPTIDVGGGFPAPYEGAADWRPFAAGLAAPLRGQVQILCEPGRLVAAAGTGMLASVISVATRNNRLNVHIDSGAYHGLLEFSAVMPHTFRTPVSALMHEEPGQPALANINGPTCDSLDSLFGGPISLPANIKVGDGLLIHHTGAYSITCASPFNGFPTPHLVALPHPL
jgi:ornithine decarboxylase